MEVLNKNHWKNIRFIDVEYLIGFALAFSLWGYYLIQTAIISNDIAKDCKQIYFK
jgi:hypothetical protein